MDKTLAKIISKYSERLFYLKENYKAKNKGDNYPYTVDIKTHNEILRDLKKLEQK